MKQDNVAIRKRTQITDAGRMMFVWIAVASVLVGAATVVSIFMVQKLIYQEKVLGAMQTTVSTLNNNLDVVEDLKTNVKKLDADSSLMMLKANEDDQALQVVLDALPSEANSLALGASLQNRLLAGIDGSFTLDSLQVTPVTGVEDSSGSSTVDASAETTNQISFSFSVGGDQNALKQMLQNLERSIRTIVVDTLVVETQSDGLTMSVTGHAFYQPAKTFELVDKAVQH